MTSILPVVSLASASFQGALRSYSYGICGGPEVDPKKAVVVVDFARN